MYYGLETGITMILFFAALVITIYAQFKINSAYSKYKKISANKKLTGCDVARQILDKNGLSKEEKRRFFDIKKIKQVLV